MFSNWCRSCRFILYVYFFFYLFLLLLVRRFASNCQFHSLSHSVFKQFHHLKWWHLQLSYLCAHWTLCLSLSLYLYLCLSLSHFAATTFHFANGISASHYYGYRRTTYTSVGSRLVRFGSLQLAWRHFSFLLTECDTGLWSSLVVLHGPDFSIYLFFFKPYNWLCLTWTWILREPDRAEKSVTLRIKIPLNKLIDNLWVAVSIYELKIALRALCERTEKWSEREK